MKKLLWILLEQIKLNPSELVWRSYCTSQNKKINQYKPNGQFNYYRIRANIKFQIQI